MNATAVAITGTDGSTSSLCLSCHDGTVAVNAQNNVSNNTLGEAMTGGTGAGSAFMSTAGNLGGTNTALSNDHPVNFTYADSTAADGTMLTAATGQTVGTAKLFTGKVQCASCHDVHDSTNVPFLRNTMSGSGLCLQCHVK
jgi:predicted CXXCH cytochrome family protein